MGYDPIVTGEKVIEHKGVIMHLSLMTERTPDGRELYAFSRRVGNGSDPILEIHNTLIKAKSSLWDFYYSKLRHGWQDVEEKSYYGDVKIHKMNNNIVHISNSVDDEPTALCVDDTGLDGFDKGVLYIWLGTTEDGYYTMLDKFGNEVNCFKERFEISMIT